MPFQWLSTSAHRAIFAIFAISVLALVVPSAFARGTAIDVQGSGIQPQIGFACCDQGIEQMQKLFADPATLAALRALHAQVEVALPDFSPERAQVVRLLNRQQIPAIAGVMMQSKDGPYFNTEDADEAPAQLAAFEEWTEQNDLRWAAVGIDLEPNSTEIAALRNHPWRLIKTLVSNALEKKRMEHAQQIYSALIGQIQARGYPVETYSLPFVPVERNLHTTLLDRVLGVPEVEGNENYVMIYTSYARSVRPAIFLELGPYVQGIAVGVTDGPPPAGSGFGPLDWNEFSGDLLVASHFSRQIGIYNLEGCVQQGFLPQLEKMDWNAPVAVSAESVSRAHRHVMAFEIALWTAAHIVYLVAAVLPLVVLLVWRRRIRKRRLIRSNSPF